MSHIPCFHCGTEVKEHSYSLQSPFESVYELKCPRCGRFLSATAWCVSKESWEKLKEYVISAWKNGQSGFIEMHDGEL